MSPNFHLASLIQVLRFDSAFLPTLRCICSLMEGISLCWLGPSELDPLSGNSQLRRHESEVLLLTDRLGLGFAAWKCLKYLHPNRLMEGSDYVFRHEIFATQLRSECRLWTGIV